MSISSPDSERHPRRWWLAATLLLLGPAAHAADDGVPRYSAWLEEVAGLEQALQRGTLGADGVGDLAKRVSGYQIQANDCIQAVGPQLQKIEGDLELLGEKVAREAGEVRRSREALAAEKSALERRLASCRVLVLRSADLLSALGELQQSALAEQLLAHGPRLDQLIRLESAPARLWQNASEFIAARSGLGQLPHGWLTLVMAGLPGVVIGVPLRRLMRRRARRVDATRSLSAGLGKAVLASGGYYLPYLLVSVSVALGVAALAEGRALDNFIVQVAAGTSVYFCVATTLALLLTPTPPAQPYLPLDPGIQRTLGRRLQILGVLALLCALLYLVWKNGDLPENVVLLLRAVLAPFLALNLIWITWLISRLTRGRARWVAGPALTLVIAATLLAEWLGFRNLTDFITRGLLVAMFGLALIWLATYLLRDLYDGLDQGVENWQRWLRQVMGLREGELMPGVFWLRSLTGLLLWGGFALVQLRVWGMSGSDFSSLMALFNEGFQIGEITIVPERLVLAVATLAAILLFVGWFKRQLSHRWLLKSRLDRGAREAVVTTTGYTGVALGVITMLSVAGLQFTNLAIIAGALSVGIGFGLQNIVNNFVSGLILLMERPIRTGDWIVVGSTEGYVRRISIRSTVIETFDRADVIVPNSDLISGQVTNWMLNDTYGRAIIPVGVAYGTDTGQARDLLLELAHNHPDVVFDVPGVPDPVVMFRGFGDSSLNLELRVFIREVDSRLRVVSDLNFEIDAAFRREGVEIPFPQRDLHVRHLPPRGGDGNAPVAEA